jgi:NADH:ubiquinone oxidoreductase subunit 5 (subunit L)/multisubunit Na+/H+ antiporter MnhA subunit
MKRPRFIFRNVVAPVIVMIGIIPTLAFAVWETIHGRGAASYSNVYGLSIPYVSVLILVLLLAFVMTVAYIARIVHFWRNEHDASAKLHKISSGASSVDSKEPT